MTPSGRRIDSPHQPEPAGSDKPIVAVFGASFLPEESPAYRTAYDLGCGIAGRGWTLACGGYGGAMEAAGRGATETGGHTIGVTCDTLSRTGRRTNPWIKEEIRCPTARERLQTLVRMADAAVALDGGIGSLSEIAFFASQIQTGELSPRPLLLLGTVWKETFQSFFRCATGYLKDSDKSLLIFIASPGEAVEKIQDHLRQAARS
jgi:uncharacterized protein (TIGR00730 family)